MKPEHICVNHPAEEAVSVCHNCKDWFCSRCLQEGPEYYYCNKQKCQKAFKAAKALNAGKCPSCQKTVLPNAIHCSSCGKELRELTAEEKNNDLIIVARYQNPMEAYLAKDILASIDIESYIADEFISVIQPAFYAFGGVKLRVKKTDFDKAFQVLNEKAV